MEKFPPRPFVQSVVPRPHEGHNAAPRSRLTRCCIGAVAHARNPRRRLCFARKLRAPTDVITAGFSLFEGSHVSLRDESGAARVSVGNDVTEGDAPDGTRVPAARIVLVSDDEQLRSLLGGLLKAHGYRGVVGVDTRSALAPRKPLAEWDIAVVDMSTSYDDTMRVLQQLKNTGAATIAIFAQRNGAAAPRELVAGTDVLLGKPFDPRELLLVI